MRHCQEAIFKRHCLDEVYLRVARYECWVTGVTGNARSGLCAQSALNTHDIFHQVTSIGILFSTRLSSIISVTDKEGIDLQ